MKRRIALAVLLMLPAGPVVAHVSYGSTASFTAGFAHPLGGLDHIAVMVMIGVWAAIKGSRALWAWPAAFVVSMLVGSAFGMTRVLFPYVEPVILASVVAMGLLVALAIDLPVSAGVAMIAVFALFHGYAHGSEVAESIGGLEYVAGFALATAALHLSGIGFARAMAKLNLQPAIRMSGALCAAVGTCLFVQLL